MEAGNSEYHVKVGPASKDGPASEGGGEHISAGQKASDGERPVRQEPAATLRDSYRVYRSDFRMGGRRVQADPETIFADIDNPVEFVGEFLRQAARSRAIYPARRACQAWMKRLW